MSKRCAVCGKGPLSGHRVSHSARKTNRRWLPNLQRVRVLTENNAPHRLLVCTDCLSAGKVRKP